jgi:CO/xanthine dehydrogenase FAD-binding subunit
VLADDPGRWTPVAGGTEIMVQFGAGRLNARHLVSIWGLPELREITDNAETLTIGGGCTFSQLRSHPAIAKHFPLLLQAASWTGSLANQNRATIAGNIVNASPAADSPPALLAYDAELELVSAHGSRRIAYADFHLGYKKTALAPGELLLSIQLQKRFDTWFGYARKTGARNAQAISKICIAAAGTSHAGRVASIHIGMGAVAPTPLRLRKVEQVLTGAPITATAIAEARRALAGEIAPIDDIRSSADYRRQVAANLLEDFLHCFAASAEVPCS